MKLRSMAQALGVEQTSWEVSWPAAMCHHSDPQHLVGAGVFPIHRWENQVDSLTGSFVVIEGVSMSPKQNLGQALCWHSIFRTFRDASAGILQPHWHDGRMGATAVKAKVVAVQHGCYCCRHGSDEADSSVAESNWQSYYHLHIGCC